MVAELDGLWGEYLSEGRKLAEVDVSKLYEMWRKCVDGAQSDPTPADQWSALKIMNCIEAELQLRGLPLPTASRSRGQ